MITSTTPATLILASLVAVASEWTPGTDTGGGALLLGPDFKADAPLWSAQLRSDLLGAKTHDRRVPPTSDRAAFGTTYSEAGTDVAMQVRFFKVDRQDRTWRTATPCTFH